MSEQFVGAAAGRDADAGSNPVSRSNDSVTLSVACAESVFVLITRFWTRSLIEPFGAALCCRKICEIQVS
jgi:hypothetical protein